MIQAVGSLSNWPLVTTRRGVVERSPGNIEVGAAVHRIEATVIDAVDDGVAVKFNKEARSGGSNVLGRFRKVTCLFTPCSPTPNDLVGDLECEHQSY
jgi:hypothetical protein